VIWLTIWRGFSMHTQDLEQRYGKNRVQALLAGLRQLEQQHPACFQALISRAVLEEKHAFELPLPKHMLLERTKRHIPSLDDETAVSMAEDISHLVLAYITAEALL
jgi:hypothetical protein